MMTNTSGMPLRRYSTDRLDLIASTADHISAELESAERLASLLDAEIGPDWPPGEYDRGAQEFFRTRLLEGGEGVIGWYGWYAIWRATEDHPACVVGAGGYLGPPNQAGEVEVGYSVVPAFQRQGYATEMVQALVDIALSDARVGRVVARTTPQNPASISVLKRVGFSQAGGIDAEGKLHFEIFRGAGRA